MSLDLGGGSEFCLTADGGDGFDDDTDLDAFGWSFQYAGTGTMEAGFQLTGDPMSTDPGWVTGSLPGDGTNTYYGVASLCSPDEATGLQTTDNFFIEADPATTWSGCYWFGGYRNVNGCGGPLNPYASYSLELLAGIDGCECSTSYCFSNPSSAGFTSWARCVGSTSIADDHITLEAYVPQNVVGFFITSTERGFVANPAGSSGNLCLGSDVGRFQDLVASSGSSGSISISTADGSWSLGSIPAAMGSYAAVAGDQANFQLWHRDS
ncbi:MAG: hypothetical protein AAGG01_13045, partial [Planctomycetota bacterium]